MKADFMTLFSSRVAPRFHLFTIKSTTKGRSNPKITTQSLLALGLFGIMIPATQAAILSDSTNQRIQIRQANTNAPLPPAVVINKSSTIQKNPQIRRSDSLQGLIAEKQRQYSGNLQISIEENKRISIKPAAQNQSFGQSGQNPYQTIYYDNSAALDFNYWLNSNRYRAQQVASYQQYLARQVGANNVPPMSELLTTARSWEKCGFEPYQLPPEYLWGNIVPTLRLYATLKQQGILPASTQIRSVYRSPDLNACAGGAAGSKHLTAGAIDIWVPEYEGNPWQMSALQDGLCQFWQYQGAGRDFGLGLYATGAIHLDTQGYRKWGFEHASSASSCRY